ncbi:3-beta-hydroxysteroid-delta(8),delta(7)-isomerase-like protein [Plakobranchus ocellatus]|uniref:3-beta-hydroxysteroid-delta(8), delta(7)-isomerase-like protein n=1 Tax=Plakobranchus ocellatus TaxID=259542 RepID=A0AAV4CY67_9GAST|nr:3-beta-hydroxysteroid-delta(8),delta(7)-isomerase-like protein [Plakobranchus ocellatus]
MSSAKHPYYPKGLKLPHYVENTRSSGEILTLFSSIVLIVAILAWIITGQRTQKFCLLRRLVLCWFMVCAFIHTVLEGYFAVYHASIAGHSTLLGEVWKEYSKGDSRYMTSDTFMVCMETITAVIDGPLAFLTFFAFMRGSNHRYGLQMLLSLCQLYGDVLYYLTDLKDGFRHGPTDSVQYFYIYVLLINAFWLVIPILLIIDSMQHISACQTVSDFYIDEYNRKHAINNHKKSK